MTRSLTHSLAVFALLAIAAPSFADLGVPKIGPRPQPKPPVPPQTILNAPADVLIDRNGQQIVLEIPRGMLNQIKQAALENDAPDQAAIGLDDRRTMVAGVALSLVFITGGLWLARRSRPAMLRAAMGLGVATVVLGATWAWANGPAPRFPNPAPADGKIQVSIRVTNQGDTVRVHIPGVLVQAEK